MRMVLHALGLAVGVLCRVVSVVFNFIEGLPDLVGAILGTEG